MKTLPTLSRVENIVSPQDLIKLNTVKSKLIKGRNQLVFNALAFNKIKANPTHITNML